MWTGIRAVKPGRPLNDIGRSMETFAQKNGYSPVRNLASHGVGRSLHDEPAEIPTWYAPRDRRRITEGLVLTIEPFLSLGADWVEERGDGWSLRASAHGAIRTHPYRHPKRAGHTDTRLTPLSPPGWQIVSLSRPRSWYLH